MTELLTESFCERCGTRYTFQAAAPRKGRLSRLRVMSKGLAGYVLNDDTTLGDAIAEARSDEDRALSSEQLEAFHKTFNFCMSCRQYTCGNCWNTAEGRCLSCAPDLSREIMPAPFPTLESLGTPVEASVAEAAVAAPDTADLTVTAWPDADLERDNGHAPSPTEPAAGSPEEGGIPLERLAALGLAPAVGTEAEPVVAGPEGVAAAEAVAPVETQAPVEPALAPEAAGAAEPVVVTADEAVAPTSEAIAPLETVAEPGPTTPDLAAAAKADASPDELAAIAAAQTGALLARFRPGQSLDEVLDAYDEEHKEPVEAAHAAAPEVPEAPVVPPVPTPSVVDGADQPVVDERPAPAAAAAIAAAGLEPALPVTEAPAEAAPGPVPTPTPAPEAPRRDDRVELPGWQITAPDVAADGAPAPTPAGPSAPAAPSAPPERPAPTWPGAPTPVWPPPAGTEPQWPVAPAAHLQASAMRAQDALWVASSLEVAQKATGVQSCVSCGLSLSATARFCRRCGTRQG
jgi:ribosomal protein L40E